MKILPLLLAAMLLGAAIVGAPPAFATHTGDHESPTDRDSGGGNDPNGKAPGQTQNPNPGK